jgi:hypothetical protein
MKRCGKCGDTKPHSEFHKQKRNRDGLHSYCKECAKAGERARYAADTPEKAQERAARRAEKKALAEQGMKSCLDCKEVKPFDEFYPDKTNRDGLHSYCRTCEAARVRASQKKYPEKVRARGRKGRARRRAREAGLPVFEISPKDQRSLDLGACAHAHLGECDGVITEDHVIPVSKPGSSHGIGNLQAMCKAHNSSKQGKWEVEARYAPELAALKARKRALVKEAA